MTCFPIVHLKITKLAQSLKLSIKSVQERFYSRSLRRRLSIDLRKRGIITKIKVCRKELRKNQSKSQKIMLLRLLLQFQILENKKIDLRAEKGKPQQKGKMLGNRLMGLNQDLRKGLGLIAIAIRKIKVHKIWTTRIKDLWTRSRLQRLSSRLKFIRILLCRLSLDPHNLLPLINNSLTLNHS